MSARRRGLAAFFLASATLAAAVQAAEIAPLAPPGAPAEQFPAPRRPVAGIESSGWLPEAERDAADEAGQVVRLLDLKPGMTVADIGAGSGFYTLRIAPMLRPGGRLIAVDVVPKYLAELSQRVKALGLTDVTVGRSDPHDPRLPAGAVDAAVLGHVYHEIAQPFAFLHNLVAALKPGARVAIVETDEPITEHGTPVDLLRCELAAVGYREVGFRHLEGVGGYVAIFTPPSAERRVPPSAIRPC